MRPFAMILAACAASTLGWNSPAQASPAPPVAEQRLAHISVQELGRGTPVVLIPGLSTPREVWSDIAPALAARHRVLLVQVNGFAGDPAGSNAQAGMLDGIVADLQSYLGSHHVERPAVIGHSLGGLLAMKLALAHPASVGRLMVVDALPFFGTVIDDKATVDSVRPVAATMRSRLIAAADAIKAKSATPVTKDPGGDLSNTADGRIRIANWSMKADPAAVGEAVYEDMTSDLRTDIARIEVPMSVLYHTGDDPAGINARTYARDYAAQPKARLKPIAGAAHFIMLDQPKAFAAAVEDFLR